MEKQNPTIFFILAYVSYNNIICALSMLIKQDLKLVTEPSEVIRGD